VTTISTIATVRAHSEHISDSLDTGESVSGPLSQVFMVAGIGIFVFIMLSAIWLIRREKLDIENPESYGDKINSFSMNARLYILHIQGMSLTFGVRSIIYNIYLLYIFREGVRFFGYDFNALEFIGVLLATGSIITGIMAPFNGIIVDKLGKKWSFIIGDFIGACMILVVVIFQEPIIVMVAQITRSAVMSIHGIAEGPFIYEQSTDKERVHLFSVSSGMSTLASMSGNLLGGLVPFVIAIAVFSTPIVNGLDSVYVLQVGLFVSVLLWWLSLVPAFFMKEDPALKEAANQFSVSARVSFKNVTNWKTIGVFVISSTFIGFGAGLFVQFFSVFFLIFFDASPAEIAIIFALGSLFIAIGNFVSPILAERYGKVKMIVITRLIGSLFLFFIPLTSILVIGGVLYLFRALFFIATQPTEAALAMETVNDAERTTLEALRMGGSSIFSAIGYFWGGFLLGSGNFILPFFVAGGLYLLSVLIFWAYFRNELNLDVQKMPAKAIKV
jgi:MFS family permease